MTFIPLVFILIIVVVACYLVRSPVAYEIRIRQGIANVVRGRMTAAALAAIREICRQNAIVSGTITAYPAGRRPRLKFSHTISPGCQQQIRNFVLSDQ